jgi:Mrp family chromosome partitioning ATPase
MKRYFASIKQYSWILLVCTVIGVVGGFILGKAQPVTYQVSSILLVEVGAPGTTFSSTGASTATAADSLTTASNYTTQIATRSVMQYVYLSNPDIARRHYTADDLLADVQPVGSTSSPTISITATTSNASDGVLLANAVASGFQNYVQANLQQHLDLLRGNLQDQLTAYQKQNSALEGKIQQLNNPSDPRTALWTTDRGDVIHNIDALQSQLQSLPTTIHSDVFEVQVARLSDAQPTAKTSTILAATAGVGLLLGAAIMLLMIFLDSRLRSEEQVKEKLGLAYIGGIASNKELAANPTNVQGKLVQGLADICANLRLTGILEKEWLAPQGAVLLITSPQSSEGKTTLAAALSATLARGGRSVVVIDGNLHQPSTHLAFGINPAGMGLSGLLKDAGHSAGDAVIRSNTPGVWLLPAGAMMDESAFIIGQKMPGILAQLRTKTDLVIIDGPALLDGADASLLSGMADGVVLVVDVRHEKLPQLLRTKELLSLVRTPVGVVMNRLSSRGRNSYYASAISSRKDNGDVVTIPTHNGNGNGNANAMAYGQQAAATFVPSMPAQMTPPVKVSAPPPLGLSTPISNGQLVPSPRSIPPELLASMNYPEAKQQLSGSWRPPLRSGNDE